VLGGATGAHNIHNYQQVIGIMVPTVASAPSMRFTGKKE